MNKYLDKVKRSVKELVFKKNDQRLILEALDLSLVINRWVGNDEFEKISLGENCNSSWYLKQTSNKNASYPYDWIFSSPEIIKHTIQDGFQSYLDKKYIYQIGENSAGHKKYHAGLFDHRNPLNTQEDYNYYLRATERFKEKLSS